MLDYRWSLNPPTYRRTVTPNWYRTHTVPKFGLQSSWDTGACHYTRPKARNHCTTYITLLYLKWIIFCMDLILQPNADIISWKTNFPKFDADFISWVVILITICTDYISQIQSIKRYTKSFFISLSLLKKFISMFYCSVLLFRRKNTWKITDIVVYFLPAIFILWIFFLNFLEN